MSYEYPLTGIEELADDIETFTSKNINDIDCTNDDIPSSFKDNELYNQYYKECMLRDLIDYVKCMTSMMDLTQENVDQGVINWGIIEQTFIYIMTKKQVLYYENKSAKYVCFSIYQLLKYLIFYSILENMQKDQCCFYMCNLFPNVVTDNIKDRCNKYIQNSMELDN